MLLKEFLGGRGHLAISCLEPGGDTPAHLEGDELVSSLLESSDDLADESTYQLPMVVVRLPSLDTVGPGRLATSREEVTTKGKGNRSFAFPLPSSSPFLSNLALAQVGPGTHLIMM